MMGRYSAERNTKIKQEAARKKEQLKELREMEQLNENLVNIE